MYRELEGIFVMIGTQRLFFNNPAYAKFIFYSAKAGLKEVRLPETKIAKKANRELEQHMESVMAELRRRIMEEGTQERGKGSTLMAALESLGAGYYADIVSGEESW